MTKPRLEDLLARYLANSLTAEESEEWRNALNDSSLKNWLDELIDNHYDQLTEEELHGLAPGKADEVFTNIIQQGGSMLQKHRVMPFWAKIAAAASLLLLLTVGVYVYKRSQPQQFAQTQLHDIAPGSDKAIITLASGQKIVLGNAKNGLIASQGNTLISLKNNHVIYDAAGTASKLQYNTLTTPRGGQYPLTLSDGTRVWLDAASSITYPVAFLGKTREVKITGQVYFEVAHNPNRPFRVTANNQTVEVLGTHFNINAYNDEPATKTTLLEGSIRISTNNAKAILKPGQQAQIEHNNLTVVDHADLDEAIAWHKGLFQFNDADIPAVMRQLSRWYDVDVSYEGKIPNIIFSGKIYRNVTALKVSDLLSYEKIHFRIEGNKIIVMP